MTRKVPYLFFLFSIACNNLAKHSDLEFKTELDKPLKEISGIVADGKDLWAITDKPKALFWNIDTKGTILQEVTIKNVQASDVEAVTKDENFVYLGDIGDNDGSRDERKIIKVSKTAIGKNDKSEIAGEIITFHFSDDVLDDKKKKNNYDSEALLSFGDFCTFLQSEEPIYKPNYFQFQKYRVIILPGQSAFLTAKVWLLMQQLTAQTMRLHLSVITKATNFRSSFF